MLPLLVNKYYPSIPANIELLAFCIHPVQGDGLVMSRTYWVNRFIEQQGFFPYAITVRTPDRKVLYPAYYIQQFLYFEIVLS